MMKARRSASGPGLMTASLIISLAAVVLSGPLVGPSWAGDGRIPLYVKSTGGFPVRIENSGSYYLTQDVNANYSGILFSIEADKVTLDLDGHSISNANTSTSNIIEIHDYDQIRVTDGQISGGYKGIYVFNGAGESSYQFDNLVFHGQYYAALQVFGDVTQPPTKVVAKNLTISDMLAYSSARGLYFRYVTDSVVEDVLVRSVNGYGMYFNSCSQLLVRGNLVTHTVNYDGYFAANAFDFMFVDNVAMNNGDEGISIDGTNNRIENCQAVDNADDGIYISQAGNHLVGNTAQGNGGIGIYVYSAASTTVQHNAASDNGQNGIRFYASSLSSVGYNTTMDNTSYGIAFVNTDYSSLDWNVSTGNGTCEIYLDANSMYNTVTYNRTPNAFGTTDPCDSGINAVSTTNTLVSNLPL